MKINTLIMITALAITMSSCSSKPDFPRVITDNDEAQAALAKKLNVVMAFNVAYHLEEGYSRDRGLTLISMSEDKQYKVAFYKPALGEFIRLGKPVPFDSKQPFATAHKERTAIKGSYKGKIRIAYVNSGKLIIEDE